MDFDYKKLLKVYIKNILCSESENYLLHLEEHLEYGPLEGALTREEFSELERLVKECELEIFGGTLDHGH